MDSLEGESRVNATLNQRAEQEAEAKLVKDAQDAAARLRAEQEAAARAKAEQEAARRQAEQEEYRKQAEQNEKQAIADVEARELAEQQAKQWEEAQRRAAVNAQAEMNRQSAEVQAKVIHKPNRAPRKPFPVVKYLASLLALAVVAAVVLPYVLSFDDYIAPIEKQISAQINQAVRIKKVQITLLPMPKLELLGLSAGSAQELQVSNATIHFDLSALFASTKTINKIELNNISLNGSSFNQVVAWMQAAGGNEKYPVARMELRGVSMTSDEIKLPLFNGQVDFDPQGKFIKADMKSEDGKLDLELQSLQKRLQLELKVHESGLPVLPYIKFNDLSVTGVIENGEIIVNDIFAHIYGGTLVGKGQLSWNNGWKLQGQLTSKSLELQNLFPDFGVFGELYGDVNFSMVGLKLAQLDKDPRLEGNFEAKNGIINKLDIDSIIRFGTRQGVAGKRSNFSQLAGTFKADNRGQRIYLNKILIGVVSGSGLLEADANQKLSGKLSVNINGVTNGSVPLQVLGTLKEPVLQSGR